LKRIGPVYYVDYQSFVVALLISEYDTAMPAVSLTDLQQQIAQRERELQALRQELESRQSHLTELTRRKEELQRQLQQVEEEITALATATPTEKEQSKAAAPARAASLGGPPRLGELIVTLLREAAKPMTARQLCEEAQRRGYQPSSQNPIKSVEARLQDLKHQRRCPAGVGPVRLHPGPFR
jgi:chromosome segregation ATPase